MDVYYGLTNYSQLKRMPPELPIMVSARWLMTLSPNSIAFRYLKRYQRVFLDSGAFGAWYYDDGYQFNPHQYADLIDRVQPEWWASMDVPCEPFMSDGRRVQLTTPERIQLTISHAHLLATIGPLPKRFVPVIQGWEIADYLWCVDLMYRDRLIRPTMGVGSICRRGKQREIVAILSTLAAHLPPDTRLHAFGVKLSALSYNRGEVRNFLASVDTAAWQFKEGSDGKRLPRTTAAMPQLIEEYRAKMDRRLAEPYQLVL